MLGAAPQADPMGAALQAPRSAAWASPGVQLPSRAPQGPVPGRVPALLELGLTGRGEA